MSSREKAKKIQADGIGKRLRGLRSETKLSVRAFAKHYGFSYSLWSDYENDRRKPNATTMEKLCDTFGVTADWIIFGADSARKLKNPEATEVITDELPNGKTSRRNVTGGKKGAKKAGSGPIQARRTKGNF